jgi:hypothetical protein
MSVKSEILWHLLEEITLLLTILIKYELIS